VRKVDNENRLILKIQKRRSKHAADLLVRRYYQEIYVYLFRQLGNKDDAMDLAQDIFISALQTIDYYDHRKSTFRTWLYRIATNKVIDFRRKSRPTLLTLDEIEIPDPDDYTLRYQDSDLLKSVEEYVSEFDDSLQTIFRLHIFDDRSFKEIAEMTGMPEPTVKTKYYRLQKKIRKEFSSYET